MNTIREKARTLKEAKYKKNEAIDPDLFKFLSAWDLNYNEKLNKINLFNQELTSQWSSVQKQLFVKLLYHQRAHFDDVLWYMGCFAPDAKTKEVILENIRDEFGGNGPSHEKLYLDFAENIGLDLTYELLEEKSYYPFLREYNLGHLKWLRENDWNHRLAAFAALERLDNLDYVVLRNVAISLGASKTSLVFFNVHICVAHFEEIEQYGAFTELWQKDPDVVRHAFNFIGNYQIGIWEKISYAIFNQTYS